MHRSDFPSNSILLFLLIISSFAIFFSCYRLQAQLLEVLDTGSKAPQIDSEIVELTNELKELFEVGGDQIDYTMEWAKKAQEIIKQPTRTRHDHQIDSSSEESRRLDLWFHESMFLSRNVRKRG